MIQFGGRVSGGLLLCVVLLAQGVVASDIPPFDKTENAQLPGNLVVVEPEQVSKAIALPAGECFLWAAPKGNGGYKSWSWHKFGPFELTEGKPFVFSYVGDMSPKSDTEPVSIKLEKEQSQGSFKNPMGVACGFVVEKAATKRVSGPSYRGYVVGTWQWGSWGDSIFHANGTCRNTYENPTGTWNLSGNTLRIKWSNGWFDTMKVAPDGKAMEGFGSREENAKEGRGFNATRKE